MRLYHGSNMNFEEIDLSKSRPFKDFGKGFYLTDNKAHAQNMALRRVARHEGTVHILEYEFNLEQALYNLSVKQFLKPDEEWAMFVMRNRDRNTRQPFHNHDIVIGPIADDDIVTSFRLFESGLISLDDMVRRLEYKELSVQYFFHNEEALKYLTKV